MLPAARIRDFRRDRYRPSAMALGIAGAIDPQATLAAAERVFGPLIEPPAVPRPDLGRPTAGLAIERVARRSIARDAVRLARIRIEPGLTPTAATYQREFLAIQAQAILDRRLDTRIKTELDCPLLDATAFSYWRHDCRESGIKATGRPGQAAAVAAVLATEYQRMARQGPTPAEVERQRARLQADLATPAPEQREANASAIAISRGLGNGAPVLHPQAERQLQRRWATEMTPDALRTAFTATCGDGEPGRDDRLLLLFQGPDDANPEPIHQALTTALSADVAAPTERPAPRWAYARPPLTTPPDLPAAGNRPPHLVQGKVGYAVELSGDAPGRVAVQVRIRVPTTELPSPALRQLLPYLLVHGGLGQHDHVDLRALFGPPVSLGIDSMRIDADGCALTISAPSTRLQFALEAARAFVIDPGFHAVPLAAAQAVPGDQNVDRQSNPHHASITLMQERLSRGLRLAIDIDDRDIITVTADDARAWFTRAIAGGELGVAIHGDVDPRSLSQFPLKFRDDGGSSR